MITGQNNGQVTFNPIKSHALHISRKGEHHNTHEYNFQNRTIENVNEHPQLGLIWNSECNWKNHLIALGKRGSQRVDLLRSLKYKLDRNTLEMIYKAFIRPFFEYASVVWHNAPRLEKYCIKGSVTVGYIFVYCRFISLFAKIQ